MASKRRNSNRRSGKNLRSPVPTPPPSPPPSAPRQPVGRSHLPARSARALAQRWEDIGGEASQTGNRGLWDVLTPTPEQASQRDEQLSNRPDVVEMDPMEWWALEMARQGNQIHLFTYEPTPSITDTWPVRRPRTLAAGYHDSTQTLRIRFRNGQVYGYYRVTPNVWRNFKRQESPGRYINRVLNNYPYAPESDLDQPTGRH